jgi:hypothetical protein
LRPPLPSSVLFELDLPANDLAELLIGLVGLQPNVKVDRGLDVAVTQQAFDDLVSAGIMAEVDCRSGMAKEALRLVRLIAPIPSMKDATPTPM